MYLYKENFEKSFSQNVLKTNGRNSQFIINVKNFLVAINGGWVGGGVNLPLPLVCLHV